MYKVGRASWFAFWFAQVTLTRDMFDEMLDSKTRRQRES